MKFVQNCITHVPVECLIEDYQALALAKAREDWDQVGTVMECLAEAIDRYTGSIEALGFKPSVSTLIAPGVSNGILTRDGCADILCAGGKNISDAMLGGVLQSHCEACPFRASGECSPEDGQLLLHNRFLYDGSSRNAESLIAALEDDNGKDGN